MAIEKRPDGSYMVRLMVRGRKRSWSAGKSKRYALSLQEKKRTQMREDRDFDKKKKCQLTFREIALQYQSLSMPEKSAIRYAGILQKYLIPYFGTHWAIEITPLMVELYCKKRKQDQASIATINLELNVLSGVFTWGIKKARLLESNPLTYVKRENPHNERDRVITEKEYARILEHSPNYLRPIIEVAMNTAMRRSEILNLQWSNVDFTNKLIVLEPEQTKGNEKRIIPMNRTVEKVIRKQITGSMVHMNYVFHYRGEPLKSVDRAFKQTVQAAGIEDFVFHDLRHCCITHWRREKKDYLSIRKITGHKTMKVFERYNSFDLSDLRAVVENSPQSSPKVTTKLTTWGQTGSTPVLQLEVNQPSTHAGVVQR